MKIIITESQLSFLVETENDKSISIIASLIEPKGQDREVRHIEKDKVKPRLILEEN